MGICCVLMLIFAFAMQFYDNRDLVVLLSFLGFKVSGSHKENLSVCLFG